MRIIINRVAVLAMLAAFICGSPIGQLRAHEKTATLEEVLNHQALYFSLLLKELESEREASEIRQMIQAISYEFDPPKYLWSFQQKLRASPIFFGAVQRSLEEYQRRLKSGELPEVFEFSSIQRGFWKRRALGLQLFTGEAGSKIAQYGLVFGIAWAAFEAIEHSITPFLPPGLGFLCATFPVLWALTLGPIMEPSKYWFSHPQRTPLLRRFFQSVRMPLTSWRLGRSLKGAHLGELVLRQNDYQDLFAKSSLARLGKSSAWAQALQSLLDIEMKSETASFPLQRVEDLLENSLSGQTDASRHLHELLSLPMMIQKAQVEELFRRKAITYRKFLSLKFFIGRIQNQLERMYRLLSVLSLEGPAEKEAYEKAFQESFESYFVLLQSFESGALAAGSSKNYKEALAQVSAWKEKISAIKSLSQKCRS